MLDALYEAQRTSRARKEILDALWATAARARETNPPGKAKHALIADSLRALIVTGTLEPGDRLPTIAEIQNAFGNPSLGTVRSGQQQLVDEGLIETRQGLGAFVLAAPAPNPSGPRLDDLTAARELVAGVENRLRNCLSFVIDDPRYPEARAVLSRVMRWAAEQSGDNAQSPEDHQEAAVIQWLREQIEGAL